MKTHFKRMAHAEAAAIANEILSELARCGSVSRFDIAGSVRRGEPTCGDIDIVAAASNVDGARTEIETILRDIAEIGRTVDVPGMGCKFVLGSFRGASVKWEIWLVSPSHYGAALNWTTGSRKHHRAVRLWCLARGYKLPIGNHRLGRARRFWWMDREFYFDFVFKAVPASDRFQSEEEFYDRIQLSWIPPASRRAGMKVVWDAHRRWLSNSSHRRADRTFEHKAERNKMLRS